MKDHILECYHIYIKKYLFCSLLEILFQSKNAAGREKSPQTAGLAYVSLLSDNMAVHSLSQKNSKVIRNILRPNLGAGRKLFHLSFT